MLAGLLVSLSLCQPHLWRHVYRPYRLQVIRMCDRVGGTVVKVRRERDGDAHILLVPDRAFADRLTSANRARLHGALVVEVVCVYTPRTASAAKACRGYVNRIRVPKVGDHIAVWGALVHDREHGGWAEIHPAGTIREAANGTDPR